jgi:hypothetical protein
MPTTCLFKAASEFGLKSVSVIGSARPDKMNCRSPPHGYLIYLML